MGTWYMAMVFPTILISLSDFQVSHISFRTNLSCDLSSDYVWKVHYEIL